MNELACRLWWIETESMAEDTFDLKVVLDYDDPEMATFELLQQKDLLNLNY